MIQAMSPILTPPLFPTLPIFSFFSFGVPAPDGVFKLSLSKWKKPPGNKVLRLNRAQKRGQK